jgi:hypothetical protein
MAGVGPEPRGRVQGGEERNMKTLDCGCQVSEIDGFRYKCCDEHADLNPCVPYWDPVARARVKEQARKAREKAKKP